jgi:hypothetical protein
LKLIFFEKVKIKEREGRVVTKHSIFYFTFTFVRTRCVW